MKSPTLRSRWKKADLAFLGVALAAHTALLLLPLEVPMNKPSPLPQRLTLELVNWRAEAEPPVPEVNDSNPETVAPTNPPNPEPWVEAVPREAMPRDLIMKPADPSEQRAEPDSVTPESAPVENFSPDHLTAALLMHSAVQPKRPQVEAGSSQTLGVPSPRGVPSNWQSGNRAGPLPTDEPGLDIVMAPARTEIVDRWLDAQGAHNVVFTLPNGETFCGRSQAWDPMQPLVEHIMMFRPCGGGGKRSFDMASRPTPRWSTAE